jgi:hypothetical protein
MPSDDGSPFETVVPVISLSPSLLLKPNDESIVAEASRPSASQRSGWLLTSESSLACGRSRPLA